MAFNPSTFIDTYNSSIDTKISIKDTNDNIVANFNVANITKFAQEDKVVVILLETYGTPMEYTLQFDSIADARTASTNLATAYNSLYPNAIQLGLPSIPAADPQSIEGKTLVQYQDLANSSSLVPLQWYSISDSGDTFGLGTNYLVQALTNDDTKPSGVIPTSGIAFRIDVVGLVVLYKEDPDNKFHTINGGVITSSGSSSNILAENNGVVNAIDSTYITARANSTATLTSSDNVIVENGANITAEGISNVIFSGVVADIGDTLSGLLSNVFIDTSSTFGKVAPARDVADLDSDIIAYVDPIDLTFNTAFTSNRQLNLGNSFSNSNSRFVMNVAAGFIGNYDLEITDKGTSTSLLTIDKSYEGSQISFIWDSDLGSYKIERVDNVKTKVATLTVGSDGQTSFTLPTTAIDPTKAILFVNGVAQIYGGLKDFTISDNTLTYLNRSYSLETIDELQIFYN